MSHFLKNVGMDRTELLEMLLNGYLFAQANYTNTLLGEPQEITRAKGILDGACMALGIDYFIEGKDYVFRTNTKRKVICRISFSEYYDMIEETKHINIKSQNELNEIIG